MRPGWLEGFGTGGRGTAPRMLPRATPPPAVILLAAPTPQPLWYFPPGQNQPQKFLGPPSFPQPFSTRQFTPHPTQRAGTAWLLQRDSRDTAARIGGQARTPRFAHSPQAPAPPATAFALSNYQKFPGSSRTASPKLKSGSREGRAAGDCLPEAAPRTGPGLCTPRPAP